MSSDFGLNKFVPAFKPGLVVGVSLYPGSLRSNQCNSGGVGILHFDDYVNDSPNPAIFCNMEFFHS